MASKIEVIDPRHLLVKVAGILHKLNISYIVTGGMAIFVWGRPRFTADIDIVIELKSDQIKALAQALKALGEAGYVDVSMMQKALLRHGEFNFIEGASGVKVDFFIAGKNSFDEVKFKNRRQEKVLGKSIYFISPEDLILSKLLWRKESGSELQLKDVESVLKIQKKLDWRYLKKWAKIQSTFNTLESLCKKHKKAVSA